MTALYIHIPFCRSKCHYCSFVSCAGAFDQFVPYVGALRKELSSVALENRHLQLESIFIGGGTPTVLPCSLLTGILDVCSQHFTLADDVEVTVEANPGTVDEGYLQALHLAGVNRLSLGVQSFADSDLRVLGRIHTPHEAIRVIRAARSAGFTNINLDLMCGLPGQTRHSWSKTLNQALALQPEHLSVYQLSIEQGTFFADLCEKKEVELPEDDEILEIDKFTEQACIAAGMQHYEISNYCQPGWECHHNVNYWLNGTYLACGVAAVSCRDGVREKRTDDIPEYIRRIETGLPVGKESECLCAEASFRETVIMGLRLIRGVSRKTLAQRYGQDPVQYYGPLLEKLIKLELIELTETHLRLTERGRPLANQVMAELV